MAYRISPRRIGGGGNDNADWRARGLNHAVGNETCRTSQALPWRIGSPHAYSITERTVIREYKIR